MWWLFLERFCAQLLHRTQRRDMEADLLREAELQQNKKETTQTKLELFQGIHIHIDYNRRDSNARRFPMTVR
jgi:hypothetical protein